MSDLYVKIITPDPEPEPETKAGRRNASKDQAHLNAALDHLIQAGAEHPRLHPEPDADDAGGPPDGDADNATKASDSLVCDGGAVKALGNGKVGGYLVTFTGRGDYDLTGDRFDPNTNFGPYKTLMTLYHHGQDPRMGVRTLGEASVKADGVGLWVEAQLAMRDEYEQQIYALAEKGKLGWSSGAVAHLVRRKGEGKGTLITDWPIAEASLTPTPAEPRNGVMSLKAWSER